MKLRVTAGVCILAAIIAAAMWDLRRSSAQVASGVAPAPAPSPVQAAATDVFISAPGQPAPPPAGVLPGQPIPAPTEVPGLSPLQPKIFKYQGNDQGIFTVQGVADKIIHLKTKGGNRQAADALRQAAAALRVNPREANRVRL